MIEILAGIQSHRRRKVLGLLAGCAVLPGLSACIGGDMRRSKSPADWPAWRDFVQVQIQQDGRVVDFITTDRRTTSEAQAYAMFFALVDNDAVLFERIWQWTHRHLMPADTADAALLPGWLWGEGSVGKQALLDPNSASDADLWMAYALLEAGRLWRRTDYVLDGRRLLQAIAMGESTAVAGFGPMLLPGKEGFTARDWTRFNPSYVPLQLLRRFALEPDLHGDWALYPQQAAALIVRSAPVGYAPDWVRWNGTAMVVDPATGPIGSWDAIRTYLWAGMLAPTEPMRGRLLNALSGPLRSLHAVGGLPEKVNVLTGRGEGAEPRGYAGALLPYLKASGAGDLLRAQSARIPAVSSYRSGGLPYYERILILYGQGWLEGRFSFDASGRLLPAWSLTSGGAK